MNTENNKIIAEFLGETKQPYRFVEFEFVDSEGNPKDTFFDGQLKFHTDWNWLMALVEKIKSIPNKEKFGMLKNEVNVILDVPSAQIVQGYKLMTGDNSGKYFDVIHYENDFITNVYNACIAFIKWYNINSFS